MTSGAEGWAWKVRTRQFQWLRHLLCWRDAVAFFLGQMSMKSIPRGPPSGDHIYRTANTDKAPRAPHPMSLMAAQHRV